MKVTILFTGAALSVFLLLGCSSVEYVNRKSTAFIPENQEIALGEEAYGQVLAENELSNDADQTAVLNRVGTRIAAIAERPQYDWEFALIEDPETVNAFALPGGKVAFYTGILPLCGNENGIAVVMGHEVGHVLARHGAERMTQGIATGLAGSALQIAVANKSPAAQTAILSGYGLATTTGVLLPFSRKQEYEADYIGLLLMAKAGYDPREALTFWGRMIELSGGQHPPEFLSTHPSSEKRVKQMEKHLPEAMEYYEAQ